ncbi:unnamed protein product [Euphydryas editha]|uniref:Reverse transcriptase n=1 Tax=Euphydryas editha TaxID=104508 RepID=A0AAU9TKZ5_EUPED|nr:unnamed protein product [Euphydryas editha]
MGNPLIAQNVIQEDLNRIVEWTKDWLLTLNIDKCTVLHIGCNNPKKEYVVNSKKLRSVDSQKDLGITITHNLKWDKHIINITRRANSMLYLIRKAFLHIDKELFVRLYKSYVRPILEYGFQIWSPYFQKDITLLEKTQRRATKMVTGLSKLQYEQRLKCLELTTLDARRQRGDLIETYKVLTGYYNVPKIRAVFVLNKNEKLRGHSLKLSRTSATSNPRLHYLPNRVVNAWNKLPQTVISAPSVNSFKNQLDKYLSQVL